MRPVVVADAGPLRYLALIDAADVLPSLFDRVLVPDTVAMELSQASTPLGVREWLATKPQWLEIRADPLPVEALPQRLDAGERAAIALAQEVGDALLLIDDRAGIEAARALGIQATGTLGVLVRASQIGLIDLRTAFSRLQTTNFRHRPALLETLLAQYQTPRT